MALPLLVLVLLGQSDGGLPAAAGEGAPAVPALTVAGFRFETRALVQVDAIPFSQLSVDEVDPSTGAPLNETAIGIRRARARLEVSRWLVGAGVELDASTVNGMRLRLFDAQVWFRWPEGPGPPVVGLAAGLMRIPFGYDVRLNNPDRLFLEEATLARALFPGDFDLGVKLHGAFRFLRYELAVMNGEPVGSRSFPAMDPNAAKDVIGRLGVAGRPVQTVDVVAGVSGLTGTGLSPGLPATKDTLTWVDANEDGLVQPSEVQVVGGLPATPSRNFSRFALGADLQVGVDIPAVGRLGLSGEVVWAANLDRGLVPSDPILAGRLLRQLGWSVGLTQELPLGFAIGARFDAYDPDLDLTAGTGGRRVPVDSTVRTWSTVVAYRWARLFRAIVQHEYQSNAFGRDASGLPTTLGGHRVGLRLEVSL